MKNTYPRGPDYGSFFIDLFKERRFEWLVQQ